MKSSVSHYSRGERRFKNRHFGKSPSIQTVIANTDYGTNKYWKKRRNRAITQARFAKYSDTFEQEHQNASNYNAWEQHIAMLEEQNHGLTNTNH